MNTLFKGGKVFDAIHDEPKMIDILVKDGKIAALGANLPADGAEVVDAAGLNIYPGLVEAHGHIGLDGWAMGYEGQDYNEMNNPVVPELRAIDAINMMDPSIKDAAMGGVTTLCTGPGSANVLGGTFAVVKTTGKSVDEAAVIKEVAMKCAFGENPKRCYRDKSISTRMSTAAKLREMLFKACEYRDKIDAAGDDASKRPAFDMKLNSLLPVVRGEMPLKAHAHQANDILTALRIAKEFGLKVTLEHCTDGLLIVDQLKEANVMLAVGPSMGQPSKIELAHLSWQNPVILNDAGLHVSIITDSPVIKQSELRVCAAMAVRAGMKPADALRCITINPAEHVGLQDRIGSIEVGKDADLVLMDGCILDVTKNVVATYIDGKKVEA